MSIASNRSGQLVFEGLIILLGLALMITAVSDARAGDRPAADPARQPVEIGRVRWDRDFDRALRESEKTGKPIFTLFQEVPGCAGCRKFGREVLSHPGLVQIIEEEFIPLLIYNNRPGKDAELLARYGEPAWNYQVVRFLDGKGKDIIPRRDRVWSLKGIAARMIAALEAGGGRAPPSLIGILESR